MNYIHVYPNVITKEFCNSIITKFTSSKLSHGVTRGGYTPDIKNTLDLGILSGDEKWEYEANILHNVLGDCLNDYIKHIETYDDPVYGKINLGSEDQLLTDENMMNIQLYKKNVGKYEYHHDFTINIIDKSYKYRKLTYIFYLNDVDEGGETEFFGHFKIRPQVGKLVIFPACWTFPHCGKMPLSNDKFILTGWLYKDPIAEDIIDSLNKRTDTDDNEEH